MPSLSGATELYVLERERLPAVLIPDSDGIPTLVDPQPILLRVVYISLDGLETQLQSARAQLNHPNSHLLAPIECPDGAPNRSGVYFTCENLVSGVSWRDEKTSHHGARVRRYAATTSEGRWLWLTDSRNGRLGYFLTGDSKDATLWRIFRLETDALNRSIFTLAPIRLSISLPLVDFSSVGDPLRSGELAEQYTDLCRSVVQHAYRDVVTKARNIVEGLISTRLILQGQNAVGRLFEDLKQVRKLLDDDQTRNTCGWRDLDYHLAHKIRLLHAQTHVGQAVASGRPLRPEFALSVVEDLVELLRTWGFCGA